VFVRFVVGSEGQHHKERTGILTEARFLRERGELTAEEDVRLAELYAWFNEHVLVPPFSTGGFPRDAVSWFKDDAGEPVTRMWDVVTLLREHGVEVRLLRSAKPGRVLYEDRVQVLVEEWNRL
jgi:hypothetical protein